MTRQSTKYPGIYYRERSKGRVYEISYTDSNGRRVFQTVAGGLRDAQRARAEILGRMDRGEKVVPSKLTVAELAEEYLRTQTSHLRPTTLRTYEGSIDKHIVPKLGRLRVSELDTDRVSRFVAEMRDSHAAWTIHGTLTPLSAMMNYAVRRGYAASNPVKGLTKHERPSDFNKPMRILSTEEIAAVLRAATDTYRLLLMTAIFSGLRIGELLRLEWRDVDFEHGLLLVRSSKTAAGVREVAVPDFLLQELSRASLVDRCPPGCAKCAADYLDHKDDRVFLTQDGEPMKTRTVARRALEATLKRANVPHCRFHDLRHTYASILIGQGYDVTVVAAQMGHSSPAMTLNVYAKLFDPARRRQQLREGLQEAFQGVVVHG